MTTKNTIPTEQDVWKGRTTDPTLGALYYFQKVKPWSSLEKMPVGFDSDQTNVALIGYASDDGVRRNQGRVGAADGPTAIKKQLSKVAYHREASLWDMGDVKGDIHECHDMLSKYVQHSLTHDVFPIVLGGGHDLAYGHLRGVAEAMKLSGKPKVGIINFDAHLDLRRPTQGPNSGTPFYQSLTDYPSSKYMALGIQKASNTRDLLEIATDLGAVVVDADDCRNGLTNDVTEQILTFASSVDCIYVTIDLDGFASSYAPGVSAPSPMGFDPRFVMDALQVISQTHKLVALDLAECSPKYDIDNMTAKLAARLVDYTVGLL